MTGENNEQKQKEPIYVAGVKILNKNKRTLWKPEAGSFRNASSRFVTGISCMSRLFLQMFRQSDTSNPRFMQNTN